MHTQGPWHVGMKPGPMVYGQKGAQVADMRETLLDRDEHIANVRLIAAAPDLLAACQFALDCAINPRSMTEAYATHKDIVAALRAAIAKATS